MLNAPLPEPELTTTDRPCPSGSAGAARRAGPAAGRRSDERGHQRSVSAATAEPSANPARTSLGWCAPVYTREAPTISATGATTAAATGDSIATAVAKAAAEAECPEGKEVVMG